MLKKSKKYTLSFLVVLLASLLFITSASAADSSTVTISPGEYVKTTRAINVSQGGTVSVEVVGEVSGATIRYYVRHKISGAVITSGSVVGATRKAHPVTLTKYDDYGDYVLCLETDIGKSKGYGTLKTN